MTRDGMLGILAASFIAIVAGCGDTGPASSDQRHGQGGSAGAVSSGGSGAGGVIASAGVGGTAGTGAAGISGGGSASAGSAGTSFGGNGGGGAGVGGAGGSNDAGAAGGGIGGAGGNGGSGGSDGYVPCPTDGSPCKILPLGDSITWGVGDEANGGYRGPLFALTQAAQQKITFTGSLQNGPGQPFPRRNEGHSGWTISTPNGSSGSVPGIFGLIPSPAFDNNSGGSPHIILMMIGTNDVGNSTGAQMADRLEALIDKITDAAPNALLVVAKICPVSWAMTSVNSYNAEIPQIVSNRADAGKHVVLADMNTGFDSGTMFVSDNLHPNTAGYEFMAERWYSVISSMLPE